MNAYTFRQQWETWYPDSLPVGHLLREQHPECWLRIYSLPGGRRYPESEADWAELLRRHCGAASVVLGENAECALVAAFVGDRVDDRWFVEQFELAPLTPEHGGFPEDNAHPEEPPVDLWLGSAVWRPGAFDAAIRRRADDRGPSFLLVALATGHVYAPYDGGADLFAPDPGAHAEIRAAVRPWLSPRRDGL